MSDGRLFRKLADLADVKHGFAFDGQFFREEPPGDILLTPGNFHIGGGFKGDSLKYYIGPVPEDFVLHEGDLLVTMTDLSKEGDTLGYPARIPSEHQNRFLHNQRLGKVTIKEGACLDKRFLYYVLCSRDYRNEILASATGSTVRHTSPERILAFEFKKPPLAEQRAIAHILGALDDKIELNRRMNETLEAIARAIFKSWFVDFGPVRARAEGPQPYGTKSDAAALFPNTFQDSRVGRIPYGWRLGSLGDVAENRRDTVNANEIMNGTPYLALEHMPKRCIALAEWTSADDVESGKFRFSVGDFRFGKLRPYFHKVGVAPIYGVCSTDILVIRPKSEEWSGFVLGHISSVELVAYSTARSDGTKMPRTNWNDLAAYPVVLPNSQVGAAFGKIVTPMLAKIRANIMESRALAAIRDALLPKLMSGEIHLGLHSAGGPSLFTDAKSA